MKRRKIISATCHPGKPRQARAPATVSEVVDAYIADYREAARKEIRFYTRQRSVEDAIEKAAHSKLPSGKRHPHQRRISAATLAEAARRLARLDFSVVTGFDDLHELVERTISPIQRIGPLAVYDIAHRIGAFLGHAPQRVYLHSGALDGARALGVGGTISQMHDLPRDFRRLTPAEAEDCLCIFKGDLKRVVRQKHIRQRRSTRP